jgi:phosphoribosyl 1,2-cyclic phosphate phosphodiesterase
LDATSSPSPARLRVHVLGSGTSVGVPVIGCDCPVCTSNDPRNKRLRSSIALEADGRRLLIDCSTDFRAQMLRDPLPRIDALLLTHTHSDHVGGIDDLRIFNYRQGEAIPVYSTPGFLDDLKARFHYAFDPLQKGGGVPHLDLCSVTPGVPFAAAGVPVLPVRIMHGKLPILGFRVGDFAYLTDCSAIPPESESLLHGLDTLILSALRHTPHPTHFTLEQALEAARRLAPRCVFFTHVADELDHETTNRALPDWARLAHDGQVLEVVAPASAVPADAVPPHRADSP